jgi:hypothetical protein
MKKRPLVEFELFHPSQIFPWNNSEDNDPHLTGYQLSQGSICFNVGDQRLLEYSPEIISHWKDAPNIADQMVGRIYVDLIEELNRFLEPIPEDLLWWMMPQRDAPGIRCWALYSYVSNASTVVDCSLLADQICDAFAGRTLLLDRLVQAPDLYFYASEANAFMSWDNREKLEDGIPVWTASHGAMSFERDDFLAEMQSFRDRYFDAMERQFALVRSGALKPNIRTDIERDEMYLREDKAKSLTEYLAKPTDFEPTDWDAVRIALKQTLDLTGLKLS